MIYDVSAAKRKEFTTKDGAVLSYLEKGEGQAMLLIHGWSQSASQWFNQINEFSATHRVIAVDLRGHGQSSKVNHGYRVYRLAADVKELFDSLKLTEPAVVMGHSVGCAILWAIWDIYGGEGFDKMIFCDITPCGIDNPTLVGDDAIHTAEGMTPEACFNMAHGWKNDADESFSRGFMKKQMSPEISDELFEAAFEHHMMLPAQHRADLWIDLVFNDWRDVIPRLTVPSFFIGAKRSLVNWKSVAWMAETAPQGSYALFELDECKGHFMFLENPSRYNQLVRNFLEGQST